MFELIKRFLSPEWTWPCPERLQPDMPMPPVPKPHHPLVAKFWAYVHYYLKEFSYRYYSPWYGVEWNNGIIDLPFGLIIKWSDGTRAEEYLATQVVRAAGFPAPLVLCYGFHPHMPHAPVSILMSRLPGKELGEVYNTLEDTERGQIMQDLKKYLSIMRKWKSPWGSDRVCSVTGTSLRSVRIPHESGGPFESLNEFNDYLLAPKWINEMTEEVYAERLAKAEKFHSINHRIVFTHGDLKHHNIMVHKGHVSGFIDWESAGWYPEYWEYTTSMRILRKTFWWYDFIVELGAKDYMKEADYDRGRHNITCFSYWG
ncbi:kinase-like protein [Xylona heveae TC161]|uniref:Kinase-like protein n=1 Tax=Xylona heveae (strain CBS 132557 / TC161) TaxID=1328760 RepID=A0A165ISF7_XYLHT|nr:kinase-like protein [Xylona heveae TC161]KZF25319.1 kinase-like protein [Xylona heveae TC161]